jgi:hypothetical protein
MRRGLSPVAARLVAVAVMFAAGCTRAPLLPGGPPGLDAGSDGVGTLSRAPALDWAIAVGRPPSSSVSASTTASTVVPLSDGGAIVAGGFEGTVAFAPDKTLVAGANGSGFVARYRRDGQLVWVRTLAAPLVIITDAAGLGDDEVVVGGWFEGALGAGVGSGPDLVSEGGLDAFVVRLAADGSARWAVRAGGQGDDIVRAVAARTVAGAVTIAITGAIADGARFGSLGPSPPGSGPIYAATLDGDGHFTTASFAGGGVPGQGYGVALDPAGGVSVTGYVNGRATFGSGATGGPVVVDPSSGRAFVARWTPAGALAWVRSLGGPDGEGAAIAFASSGALVVCGLFQGTASFGAGGSAPVLTADVPGVPGTFLAAIDPADGHTSWATRLAGIGVRPWRLRASAAGGLLVAASFGGGVVIDPDGSSPARLFSNGGDDPIFIRLDAGGTLDWAVSGGGPGDDEGADVADAVNGLVWATGSYVGPAAFGMADRSTTLASGTDGAGFLLRFAASP